MSRSPENAEAVLVEVRKVLGAASPDDCAHSLAALISATSKLPLNNLDAWERLIRSELWSNAQNAQSRRWRPWRPWRTNRKPNTWLELCNADGFSRERAMREIAGSAPNGFFFSLALRRLNDWVPQVRSAACEQIPIMAAESEPDVIIDALWSTLPHFPSWGRTTAREQQVIFSLLSIESIMILLKDRILRAASGPSTKILVQASRVPALDPWLSEIASRSIQPSTRARAYRSLLEHRVTWSNGRKWVWTDLKWCKGRFDPVIAERQITPDASLLATLMTAIADPSPIVRRVGAELLIKNMDAIGTDAHTLAEKLANDSSPYVSERGKFALTALREPPQ